MSTINYITQSIKITIRTNTSDNDVQDTDYINLFGGIYDSPSLIDFDTPLLQNLKPSFVRTETTDNPDYNPSVNPSDVDEYLYTYYRTWEIYYKIKEEGLYQFSYLVFDRYNNVGNITDTNPSDEPENFEVCLTPKQANTCYDASLNDDPSNDTSTLTLSF